MAGLPVHRAVDEVMTPSRLASGKNTEAHSLGGFFTVGGLEGDFFDAEEVVKTHNAAGFHVKVKK